MWTGNVSAGATRLVRTDGEKEKRVGDLPVEPDRLVEGHEPAPSATAEQDADGPGELRSECGDDVAQHGQQQKRAVDAEAETGSAARPDRVLEAVQDRELRIGRLRITAVGEAARSACEVRMATDTPMCPGRGERGQQCRLRAPR